MVIMLLRKVKQGRGGGSLWVLRGGRRGGGRENLSKVRRGSSVGIWERLLQAEGMMASAKALSRSVLSCLWSPEEARVAGVE